MSTPGGQAGFFSGLLGGVGEGLLSAQKQKHDDELKKNAALSQVYLKAIENGDIEPQHGIPLVANILSGSFSSLTGDKKGSKQDKNFFSEVLGDPEKLSGLLLGFHKATNSSPASGPAGPTGLPTSGPVQTGEPQEGAQGTVGTELASRSGTATPPPKTSIFVSPGERMASTQALKRSDETFRTNEEIRRWEATTGQKAPTSKPPTGAVGQHVSSVLAEMGETWETADPDARRVALETGVKRATDERLKKEADAAAKTKNAALRPEQKRAAQLAEAQGLKWEAMDDSQKQTYTTLAARTIENEKKVQQAQAAQRTSAALAMSYASLAKDKVQLSAMEENAPLTTEAKRLGIEIDKKRLAAVQSKDPTAVLEQARKLAHSVATQGEKTRGFFSKWFGDTPPTEDQLTDQYIQEWTGQDPSTVRGAASQKNAPRPVTSSAAPATSGNPFR